VDLTEAQWQMLRVRRSQEDMSTIIDILEVDGAIVVPEAQPVSEDKDVQKAHVESLKSRIATSQLMNTPEPEDVDDEAKEKRQQQRERERAKA